MNCKKVKFVNEASAMMYVNKLQKTSIRDKKPVRAYLCETCLSWHLTSIESKENMKLIYAKREIANLKRKNLHLIEENNILKVKLGKCEGRI